MNQIKSLLYVVYLLWYECPFLSGFRLRFRPLRRQTRHEVRIRHQLRIELPELEMFAGLGAAHLDSVLTEVLTDDAPLDVHKHQEASEKDQHQNHNNYHSLGSMVYSLLYSRWGGESF